MRILCPFGDGVTFVAEVLEEIRIKNVHEGDIEAVEPHHRLVGRAAMIVPCHLRRCDVVALAHDGAFTVHGRIGALAFDDEALRGWRVAMRSGYLSRPDHPDPR